MAQYNSSSERWEAYQFCDPFASSSFVCCNKKNNTVCRPLCDFLPKVASKEDILFMNDIQEARTMGFEACSRCDPASDRNCVDLELLKRTIEHINKSIGFSQEGMTSFKKRALSTPAVKTSDGHFSEHHLTRNESEHIKLVELACRHIAHAAAENVLKQQREQLDKSQQKKKRRGGVLGFKELASKSKLSPWHFHRVFKSVTGLTPKAYGDQCWKFIKSQERPSTLRTRSHFRSNSDITKNYTTGRKLKMENDDGIAPTEKHTELQDSLAKAPVPAALQVQPPHVQHQQQTYSFGSNLDINMRHHSLDLGLVAELGSMNAGQLDSLLMSPEFSSLDSVQSLSDSVVPLDMGRTSLQFDQNTPPQFVSNESEVSTTPSLEDGASLSLYPGEGPFWPSLEASTPPQDFKEGTQESLYNVLLENSPLDNDGLFHMTDYPGYSALGAAEGVDSDMLFGEESMTAMFEPQNAFHQPQLQSNHRGEDALFQGITMMKPDTNDLRV